MCEVQEIEATEKWQFRLLSNFLHYRHTVKNIVLFYNNLMMLNLVINVYGSVM